MIMMMSLFYHHISLKLKLPFCQNNEIKLKHFLKKFHHFTKNNFDIAIIWEIRKIQTLFHLKNKKLYPACKIYYGVCEWVEDYIGETKRNTITRWSEHDDATKDSEPARHLNKHITMFLPGKFYATPLKTLISAKIWKQCLLHY